MMSCLVYLVMMLTSKNFRKPQKVEPFVYQIKMIIILAGRKTTSCIREGLALLRLMIKSARFFLDLAVKQFPSRLHNTGG